jgi:uncharacterized protein YbjT (DUF2867 family)
MSTVLVTGGSGFVGSHVILQLLSAGHVVQTTVRSLKREESVRAMLRDGGADAGERLSAVRSSTSESSTCVTCRPASARDDGPPAKGERFIAVSGEEGANAAFAELARATRGAVRPEHEAVASAARQHSQRHQREGRAGPRMEAALT